MKPKAEKTLRAVTPFNNLIGGLILTQVRRKVSVCPVDPPPQTKALVNTFGCQVENIRANIIFFFPCSISYNDM